MRLCQCDKTLCSTEEQSETATESNSVFPIRSLSIPGIWKKKHHSLRSTAALVNNPSMGATSESPAWSSTWWVPCQFRTEGVVERGKNEMRPGRRKGGGGGVYPSLLSHDHWSTTYCTLPEHGTCITIFLSFFTFVVNPWSPFSVASLHMQCVDFVYYFFWLKMVKKK